MKLEPLKKIKKTSGKFTKKEKREDSNKIRN